MTETARVVCDLCGEEVSLIETLVDMGAHGVHFHMACFQRMTAVELVVIASMDDGKVMRHGDWQGAVKMNSYFKRHKGANDNG